MLLHGQVSRRGGRLLEPEGVVVDLGMVSGRMRLMIAGWCCDWLGLGVEVSGGRTAVIVLNWLLGWVT